MAVEIYKRCIDIDKLEQIMYGILPEQGAIEVQNDSPNKKYDMHKHDRDETLIVLKGSFEFFWEGDNKALCGPGDVIILPKGTYHGAITQPEGAIYFIAFQNLSDRLCLRSKNP